MRQNVAIVGAGPAGCVAASMLAQRGFEVTVFEQHRFPRDKVCGECVSALGRRVLRDIGALPAIEALGAVRLQRALIHSVDGGSLELALPTSMIGVSRRAMDMSLLDHARSCGATIREHARCEGLQPGDRPTLLVRDIERNVVEPFAADYVLLAEGKADWLPPRDRPAPTGDIGIKAHFSNVNGPRDAIELFGADRHYGGLAPIEDGLWNIAFSIPARQLRRGDVAGEFSRIVERNRSLALRLRNAIRVGAWLASPLPRFEVLRSESWPADVIPIGNAVAALEPIGGEGMGLAMRSAQLAADAITAGAITAGATTSPAVESRGLDRVALREAYLALWRRRSMACRAAAWIVSRPTLCDAVVRCFADSSALPHMAMRLMGKAMSEKSFNL